MGRRVLLYAVLYGSVGVAIGVLLALYTADMKPPHKNIIIGNKNGSASKAATQEPTSEPIQVEEIN
jgi:hypothetical protein